LEEFKTINIIPVDEESLNVFTASKTSNSLTRKRGKSNPNPKTYVSSKLERTSSKRSKSLGSLIKSNRALVNNSNATYSSINFKNMNIQNKYYINIVRQRHNKICETHKKILDVLELNSRFSEISGISGISRIRLKTKVISKPTRLSGTLKKKSISKSNSPTSIMAF
jgi:hypothetical protein